MTVAGLNGCTTTGSATVDDIPIPFNFLATLTDQTSCVTNNGRIVLTLLPGNLSLLWSNGATTSTINNLAPGDYTVTVSAGGTCTTEATYTLSDLSTYPVIPLVPTSKYL